MPEVILASLLFQVAAGLSLLLCASCVAATDLFYRRPPRGYAVETHEPGTVVELPTAPRAPKLMTRVDLEDQSEAA